jgi:3-dehydroquinate synthetase
VSEDEKESGLRTILNYGHTIAHGLEAGTGYGRFLHGEAVAIGMMGAAGISRQLGLISPDVVQRQEDIVRKLGLPTACTGVDAADVLRSLELDKKVRDRKVRWVLLKGVGRTVIRDDVPGQVVETVVRELLRS